MRYGLCYSRKALSFIVALLILSVTQSAFSEKSHYLFRCIKVSFDGSSITQETTYKYRLFSDVDLDKFSQEQIDVPRKGKIQDFSLKLNGPHFKPVSLSRKDGLQFSRGQSFELATDRMGYYWYLGKIESGSEIDCSYSVKDEDPDFLDFEAINAEIVTDSLSIKIKYPSKNWRLRYSIDGAIPQYAGDKDETTFVWKNIPSLEETDYKHAPYDVRPGLRYSFESKGAVDDFSGWNDVYNWYTKRADSVSALTSQSDIMKITRQPAEIVSAIDQQCHYVAIELGEGGYVPDRPDNVWTKGYGDCKGLANLFVSWMKASGHSAWPVLVYSGHDILGNFDFPTPYTFNHVIAGYINDSGDTAYQDLTAEYTPLGYLPISEYGCFAYPIIPNATPMRLGYFPQTPDTIRFCLTGELADNGTLNGMLDADIYGQTALKMNWMEKQNRNVKDTQRIKSFLTEEIPKGIFDFINLDSLNSNDRYHFSANLKVDKFALPRENSFAIKSWVFGLFTEYLKADTSVSWESFITRNTVYVLEYRVKAVQGKYSHQDSDNWQFDYPGLQAKLTNSSHGDSLITDFTAYLMPMTLSPEQYKLYISNCKQVQRSAQAGVLFTQ